MLRLDDKRVIYEQMDPEFNRAWEALRKGGHNPAEFMYMFSEIDKPGQVNHAFKNSLTRQYVYAIEWTGGEAA